ncbi:hypothetical protein [Rhodoflexus sp.]
MQGPSLNLPIGEIVEPILSESYGRVLYLPRFRTVFVEMLGSFSHSQYQGVYTTAYEALKRLQANACVVSQMRSYGSSFQDRNWLITYLLPQLSKSFPTKEFLMIGLREADHTNAKRWIANYLERSFTAFAPFSVKSAPDLQTALALITEHQQSLWH